MGAGREWERLLGPDEERAEIFMVRLQAVQGRRADGQVGMLA